MCSPRRVRSSLLLNFAFVFLLSSWEFSRFPPGPNAAQAWLGVSGSIVGAGTRESRSVSGWAAANRLIPYGIWIFRSAEMGESPPSTLQSESVAWDRIVVATFCFFCCLGKWKSGGWAASCCPAFRFFSCNLRGAQTEPTDWPELLIDGETSLVTHCWPAIANPSRVLSEQAGFRHSKAVPSSHVGSLL